MHTRRAPHRRFDRTHIELGIDPPLRADGGMELVDHSAPVNLRWLSGTILTAIAGCALMSGAVYAALDSSTRMVGSADGLAFNVLAQQGSERRFSNVARKSDRMSLARETWDARQEVRLTITHRDGDREVVRIRPVTRLVTQLATSTTELISDIPAFNPVAIYAEQDEDLRAEPVRNAEGDVSYVIRDLASLDIGASDGPLPAPEDMLMDVREAATAANSGGVHLTAMRGGGFGVSTASLLAVPGLDMQDNSFRTIVPKSSRASKGGVDSGVRRVTITATSRLEKILTDAGARPEDARAITGAFGAQDGHGVFALEAGQELEILMGADDRGVSRPLRVRLFAEGGLMSAVALADTGSYVAVDEDGEEAAVEVADARGPGARLYESLYETALRHDVSEKVVAQLVRIIGTDVDFQRRVTPNDTLELVFAEPENSQGPTEVLYAGITLGGELRRYYLYQPPGSNTADYFDENGRSARKFLMRKPIATAVLRSGFGSRRHPILGYSKMHTGVDWAAPRGTPIYAAGNGTVVKAGWEGGYGRYIKIRHANGYETAYAHQSNFARGIAEGVTVRQGQVIGYVGSTGLSTGPHLHYEVLVNGRFVNPTRIRVPRELELSGEALASFQRERERIDALMQPAVNGQRLAARE